MKTRKKKVRLSFKIADPRNEPKPRPWKWVNGKPDNSFYGRLAASVGMAFLLCGCAYYENSVMTPDSFNYTVSVDHQTHDTASYIGLTWNLKPHK